MAAPAVNNDIMSRILARIESIEKKYDDEFNKLQNGQSNDRTLLNDLAEQRRELAAERERERANELAERERERANRLAEYQAAQTENDRAILLINRAQNAEQRDALVEAYHAAQPASTCSFCFCVFSARCALYLMLCRGF